MRKNEQGFALVLSLVLMLAMSLMGGALIVISAANFAASILIESGLSFLGLGAQPPMTSWGLMIKDHYNYIILGEPFLAIIPGICIMLLVCSFMMLGNSLRDLLDVKN